jgi:hypothetical protein
VNDACGTGFEALGKTRMNGEAFSQIPLLQKSGVYLNGFYGKDVD